MKRSFRDKSALFLFFAAFAGGPVAFAQGNADPNQLLAFKKLYIEPVKDNVDGAFQAPVLQSFREIFDRNPRFELVGEQGQADTVIRTVLDKKATGTDIDITVLLATTGEVFTAEHDSVSTTATGRDTGTKVKQLLKAALKRIPFYGTITGRDGQELTFDIGAAHGLRKNDVIQVSRIDNIKRHPLLKSIVDVQLVPVGSAVVDSVEDTISFGHVKSEITGEKLQKLHKITAIEARLAEPSKPQATDNSGNYVEEIAPKHSKTSAEPAADDDRPQLGYVGLGLQLSSFSNSSSVTGGATVSGGGFSPGARVNAELWLTKRWFVDLAIGAATVSYTPDTAAAAASSTASAPSTSTSTRSFGFNAGYKYLPDGNLYGPQVSVKLGYSSWTWSTPVSPNDQLSSKSYSGLNLGLGGVLPITSYDWGVLLNINVLLFPSLTEDTYKQLGTDNSASGTTFFAAGYHYFNPKLAIRSGPLIEIYSANSSNDSGNTTSQKTFGLLTSILYYF